MSTDPDGTRLPIRLDTTSNGEFIPVPLGPEARHANALANDHADANAKRIGLSRRSFLTTAAGAATSLLAINEAFAQDAPAGRFDLPPDAGLDLETAAAALGKKEFIFDIQTHHVNPDGPWRTPFAQWNINVRAFPQSTCGDGFLGSVFGSPACFSAEHFVKEVFLDSDTDMAVLTFVPSLPEDEPLTVEEAAETRAIVDSLEGSKRLLLHGRVQPNLPGDTDRMDGLLGEWNISAWKTYTQFGPETGFWLDDPEVGLPFLEKVRASGVPVVCIHKGLALPGLPYEFSKCRDVGVVAKLFPDITFIIYHSGFQTQRPEGPLAEGSDDGIDGLINSLRANDVPPNSNVFAELGSSWRFMMRDPTTAAHALGKLLKYVGERNVLWGTDSIWYGSPQDQIQAFRSFQIDEAVRDAHGYPELTPALRAGVFGLNALGPYGIDLEEAQRRASLDVVSEMKLAYAERPEPSFQTYGPSTRRDFWRLIKDQGGFR